MISRNSKPIFIWVIFCILISIIFYFGLKACALIIPGLGAVVERCPNPSELSINVADDEGKRLLDDFLSLRAALALSPACDENSTKINEMDIEGLEPPPPINQSDEVVFVIDASRSMNDDSGINSLTKMDVAKDLLKELMVDSSFSSKPSLWRYGDSCIDNTVELISSASKASEGEIDRAFISKSESSLARAILSIPNMIGAGSGFSESNPANVVLVVDGDDLCGAFTGWEESYKKAGINTTLSKLRERVPDVLKGRPDINIDDSASRVCGAARRVYSQLPHLAIHVVSLFPAGSTMEQNFKINMECVTGNGKGWYINSPDASKIKNALKVIAGGG